MKKRIVSLLVLVLLLVMGATWLLWHPAPLARSVSGTIETDEVHVASRYGGRVEAIAAAEGDALTNGQLIVSLDAKELSARRANAAAVLAELEHGPRPEEIAAAKADWESLAAQLEFAQTDERRTLQLFAENTVSQNDRDLAVSRASALAQSVAAAKQRYQLLKIGTRAERLDQARAQLAEIDTQLAEMRISAPGVVNPAVGGTASPRSVLGETRAQSATDREDAVPPGYVLEVLSVKVGDVLGPNREVATLLLPQHLWVRVYAPESWLGLIQLNQTVTVRTDSTGPREFAGVVEQINRQAEFTPRNVQTVADRVRQVFGVKIRLPAETGVLRAGMSVDVFFPNVPPPPK